MRGHGNIERFAVTVLSLAPAFGGGGGGAPKMFQDQCPQIWRPVACDVTESAALPQQAAAPASRASATQRNQLGVGNSVVAGRSFRYVYRTIK
jgi:hypothetical protein